jgi:hypothetical protein
MISLLFIVLVMVAHGCAVGPFKPNEEEAFRRIRFLYEG